MKRLTTALLVSTLLAAPAVHAEPPAAPAGPGIRASMEKVRFDSAARPPFVTPQPAVHKSSTAKKVSGGIAMGFLGMLAGGWVGQAIDGNCRCDDPGLKGALIGMPIGAVAGAIAGVWLASR